MSSWLGPRSIDGGLDRIPLLTPPRASDLGGLWLCGKHLVGPDPEGTLERADANLVVCLCERHELADRYPDYVEWLDNQGGPDGRAVWASVPDLHAHTLQDADTLVDDLLVRLRQGHGVVIHCGAGKGRAPTLAILVLLALGYNEQDALKLVADTRPMAGPESGAQADLVRAFARR